MNCNYKSFLIVFQGSHDNDFCLASFADYKAARLFILKLRVAVILSDDFVIADHEEIRYNIENSK